MLSNTNPSLVLREGHSFRLSAAQDTIPSKLFTVTRSDDGVEFLTELSDLKAAGRNPFGRLYDDAADVGFVMRSDRTGEVVVYALASEEHSEDGDLLWLFRPTQASARRVPAAADTVVTILND